MLAAVEDRRRFDSAQRLIWLFEHGEPRARCARLLLHRASPEEARARTYPASAGDGRDASRCASARSYACGIFRGFTSLPRVSAVIAPSRKMVSPRRIVRLMTPSNVSPRYGLVL